MASVKQPQGLYIAVLMIAWPSVMGYNHDAIWYEQKRGSDAPWFVYLFHRLNKQEVTQ
jgi:hypothetical protein